jgi:integrase
MLPVLVFRKVPVANFTKNFIDRISTPDKGEAFIWDDGLPGFGLRVYPSGRKVFIVQYRNDGRRTRRMSLGRYGTVTLDEARKAARKILTSAVYGTDPADEKRQRRIAPTLSELWDDYLTLHARPNKRPASVAEDERVWKTIIKPELGSAKVAGVDRRDIEVLHRSMQKTPYMANRALALLSKMFDLAEGWKWRSGNPTVGVSRYPEQSRTRWLSIEEIKRLGIALDKYSNQTTADVVRFLLLTGARRGEALAAQWKEFDLTNGIWTKPSAHTKQKRESRIPLNGRALALLASRYEDQSPEAFVFPGQSGEQIKDLKRVWQHCREAAELSDARLHDLRHTFASHLVSGGESLAVIGTLMGHTQSTTTQRYAHLADDPQRAASDRFGGIVEAAESARAPAEVIQLRSEK